MVKNIFYSFVFLPVLLFIGIMTSYQDWKNSRIRNVFILIGIIYSFLVYSFFGALFWASQWLSFSQSALNFISVFVWKFDMWCINLLFSMLAGYVLWKNRILGAGDAKLFICFSALIPIGQYSLVYFKYRFASFALLLAIFVPPTMLLLARALFHYLVKIGIKDSLGILKGKLLTFNRRKFLKTVFVFVVLFMLLNIVNYELQRIIGNISFFTQNRIMLLSLITAIALMPLLRKSVLMLALFVVLIAYALLAGNPFSWYSSLLSSMLKGIFLYLGLFPFVKWIIKSYIEKTQSGHSPFAFWLFLGALIVWFF